MGSRTNQIEVGRTTVGDQAGISNVATTVNVPAAVSGFLPTTVPFYAAIEDSGGSYESVLVTAIGAPAGGLTPWTIVRGQEGTAAVAHALGAGIEIGVTEAERARILLLTGRLEVLTLNVPGALTVGQKATNRIPVTRAMQVVRAIAAVGIVPATQAVITDISKNGTTDIFGVGNRPSIAVAGSVSQVGAAPPVAAANLAPGDFIQPNIIQVGVTPAGSDLVITVEALIL